MQFQLMVDLLLSLACLYPAIKIYQRAGIDTRLAAFVLVPFLGLAVAGMILSLSQWNLSRV